MPCSPLITSTFLYGRIFALLKFEIHRGVHISTPQTKTVNHSPKYLINHEWTKYSIEQKVYFTTMVKIHPLFITLSSCAQLQKSKDPVVKNRLVALYLL